MSDPMARCQPFAPRLRQSQHRRNRRRLWRDPPPSPVRRARHRRISAPRSPPAVHCSRSLNPPLTPTLAATWTATVSAKRRYGKRSKAVFWHSGGQSLYSPPCLPQLKPVLPRQGYLSGALSPDCWSSAAAKSSLPDLIKPALIPGACHTYVGEEAIATGVCASPQRRRRGL